MWKNKKMYLILGTVCIFLLGGYLLLCSLASKKVHSIFIEAMAKQQVLRGTVSVQEITADLWGRVNFKNLTWLDPEGEPVVFVPQGSLKVNTWDIITRQFNLDTLEELTLENALLSVAFNEQMQLDVVRYQEKHQPEQQMKAKQNLQLQHKIPRLRLQLRNCLLSAQYQQRYFALNGVYLLIDSKSRKEVLVDLHTGPFGGQLVGERLSLKGKILLEQEPRLQLSLLMDRVLPEAMGLRNVRDLATVTGQVEGSWQQPVVNGTLSLEQLKIPALHLNNVKGNYYYEDGLLQFNDIHAGLYGGYVNAQGRYYLDSRDYQLHAVGKEMLASLAARSSKINCKVDLDLHMDAQGGSKQVHSYGSFRTGRGSYLLIPFTGISGEFDNYNKELSFSNVVIETFLGDIATDAFRIVDGQLSIENLSLTSLDGEKVELEISNK